MGYVQIYSFDVSQMEKHQIFHKKEGSKRKPTYYIAIW